MSDEFQEHAPLRRQKDWKTERPCERAVVAPGFGAMISVRFDAEAARLIRQAAKNANQTQTEFVHEAALAAAQAQTQASTVAEVITTGAASDVPQVQGGRSRETHGAARSPLTNGEKQRRVVVERGS